MKCAREKCDNEINGFFCAKELPYNKDETGDVLVTAFEATTGNGGELCQWCKMEALRRLREELMAELAGGK